VSAALRVAVVGAGRMGRVHLAALARAPSLEAVAVVDPVPEARAATGLPGYAAVEELLGAGGFDAALIVAPSDRHPQLVSAFADAGVPMLCEKPCGVTPEQARAAAAAADAAGVLLQVGYWRRFVPDLVALRERIAAGGLGDVFLVSCWQWDEHPPAEAFRRHSGGIAVDMGVHELDCIRWLLGQEIERVAALAAGVTAAPPVPGDPDCLQVLAGLSGGAVATVSLGRRFPPGDCCWLEAMGTEGYARSEFMWGAAGERVFQDALVAQAEAFAAAVRGERPQQGASAHDAEQALAAAGRVKEAFA
jgi:myo-inositol 2-dehydrogenase / D-chiro-inositol 1-dehydrogenase